MAEDRSVEEAMTVFDENGIAVVRVALALTVYFRDADKAGVRQAVLDGLDGFLAIAGPRMRWLRHPTTSTWHRATDDRVAALRAWLPGADPMDAWEFHLHAGETSDDASDLQVSAMGLPSWSPEGSSYFKVVLPITWFADHPGSLPELALLLCRGLRPLCGYGGLGFVASANTSFWAKSDPAIFTMAQRFPGIDVDEPAMFSVRLGERIKSVNWLTVLDDPLLARLGGREALRAELPEGVSLIGYEGGAIIQAGPRPQMGDADDRRLPPAYVAVNRLLRPLRIASMGLQIGGRGPRFDRATSEAWLSRFD